MEKPHRMCLSYYWQGAPRSVASLLYKLGHVKAALREVEKTRYLYGWPKPSSRLIRAEMELAT
jgi:hypothetical protein